MQNRYEQCIAPASLNIYKSQSSLHQPHQLRRHSHPILVGFATQLNRLEKQAITLGYHWNRPPRLRLSGLTSELSFPKALDWNRNTGGGNDIQGRDHNTIICTALSISTDCPLFS
jgi:hypothetical protein